MVEETTLDEVLGDALGLAGELCGVGIGVQVVAFAVEVKPDWHAVQLVDPAVAAKVPILHPAQMVDAF